MSPLLSAEESPGKMYALATVLTLLAIAAVALRVHARRMIKSGLAWDDFLVVIALLFTIATGVCVFAATANGNLGRHTQIDSEGYPVIDNHTEVLFKSIFASQLTHTLAFGFTKLAVLFFYKRIFCGRSFEFSVWIMVAVTVAWTIAFFFANLFQCVPISTNWIDFGATPEACINTNQMYIAHAWSDVFTDVAILSLPIPSIWSLQLPKSTKVAVTGLMLLGSLVVIAGVARLVVFYEVDHEIQSGNLDITYLLTPGLYWPMVEAALGVVSACLPSMRPIFKRCVPDDGFWKFRDNTSFRSLFGRHSKPHPSQKHLSNEVSRSSLQSLPLDSRKKENVSTRPEREAVCDERW